MQPGFLTQLADRVYARRFGVKVQYSPQHIAFQSKDGEIRIAPNHHPYSRDMIRMFNVYYGSVFPDAAGVADFSGPRLHRYRASGAEFYLPSIPEEQEALDTYCKWYRPKEGDVVFDIGAHAGVSTYELARAVGPTGKVYAFEPDPVAYPCLLENLERHRLKNVVPVKKAIAEKAGLFAFNVEGAIGAGLSSFVPRGSAGSVQQVDAITLEDAFESGPPQFVKMDIEGAELSVLAGASDYLRNRKIGFAIDTNHLVDGELTSKRVVKIFQKIGYEAETITVSGCETTLARAM